VKLIESSATLSLHSPASEMLRRIEEAGRTAYRSEEQMTPESTAAFAAMIIKRGHLSVLEHASLSFRFVCDRGVSHEIVRHRIASYTQESTRYCNYSKEKFGGELTFVVPTVYHNSWKHEETDDLISARYVEWKSHMLVCEAKYLRMIERGESPQIARGVLPNSLKTEIYMTANVREWVHFFSLRTDGAAHPDMRHLAGLAARQCCEAIPVLFDGFRDNGYTCLTDKCDSCNTDCGDCEYLKVSRS